MKMQLLLLLACFAHSNAQHTSFLDGFLNLFRFFRRPFHAYLENREGRGRHIIEKKFQSVSPTFQFPCDLNDTRSTKRPTSVHKLRPGDIDVIGAMGDSLTAGFGVHASSTAGLFLESRGTSFSIGGEGTWRQHLTIPNILKNFNPNLIGFSLRTSLSINRASQFNVAEGGSVSDEMPYMAKILVKRILNDPRVDVKNDWKMITIFIGANDFCSDICFFNDLEKRLVEHENDILQALRTLRDYLPRTIVNLIPAVDTHLLKKINNKSFQCVLLHSIECPCVFGLVHLPKASAYHNFINRWIKMDQQFPNLDEFKREDFAVVSQPFTVNMTLPRIGKQFDFRFTSTDCFHFSQKGQSIMANSLWNNMLEPVGRKHPVHSYNLFEAFKCPSKENPFIYTSENSENSL